MEENNISKEQINNLLSEIEKAHSILISSHSRPDDDSIGSVLSTYHVLSQKYPNKHIEIEYTGDIDSRHSYFENFDKIKSVQDISDELEKFDLFICLDTSHYHLISKDREYFKKKINEFNLRGGKSIVIDHHKGEPDQFDLSIININASSNSENIYRIFCQNMDKIESRLAETLLLGILGDTGYLEFIKPEQAYVFDIVKRLVQEGEVNIQSLKSKYATYSVRVFRLIQKLMENATIEDIPGWPTFIYTYVSREYLEQGKYTDLEISAASVIFIQNSVLSLKEVSWGFVISPRNEGHLTVNFRSKPMDVNVRILAQSLGIGGGHDQAAAGRFLPNGESKIDYNDGLNKILSWMGSNLPIYIK